MLEKTAKWYKKFYDSNEVITESQIEEFIKDAKAENAIWCE